MLYFYQIKCNLQFSSFLGVGNGNGSDLRFQIITDGKVTLERVVNDKLGQMVCTVSHRDIHDNFGRSEYCVKLFIKFPLNTTKCFSIKIYIQRVSTNGLDEREFTR